MVIEENGKLYDINEETGLVTLAAEVSKGLEDEPVVETPLAMGDRVEVASMPGVIVAKNPGVYGDVYAVRFDEGDTGEYLSDVISKSKIEVTAGTDALSNLKEQFVAYENLPAITEAEIEHKLHVAEQLQREAKTIMGRYSNVGDQAQIDRIAYQMSIDLRELAKARDHAQMAANEDYLNRQPSFHAAENFTSGGASMGIAAGGDASWLELEAEDFPYTEVTDGDLATRAAETVAQFNRQQLEDDSFVSDAASFQATYLGIQNDNEKKAKFARLVESERRSKLAQPVKETKVAAAEDDIGGFDATALFV